MKIGILDIGSNSARLLVSDGNTTLSKEIVTTRLSEDLKKNGFLLDSAIDRTINGIKLLLKNSRKENLDKIFAFATEAVRSSSNRDLFVSRFEKEIGVKLDVISGEKEALCGVKGALKNNDGGIIDVGGASTEISVQKNNRTIYSYSAKMGSVVIKELCGQDRTLADNFIFEKIKEYGLVPSCDNFYAVGGTATTIAALMLELEPYDRTVVHGYKIKIDELSNLCDKLYALSVEERKKLKGLDEPRADVIAGGVLAMLKIMQEFNLPCVTVSEDDNLEGYLHFLNL